jgi:hypothetical protein
MKAILLSILLVGCSSQIPVHQDQNSIAAIAPLPSVTTNIADTPTKPQVQIVGNHVELNKQGMVDLVNLYKDAKTNTNERNQLVLTVNKVIDERNQLLVVAKQEELRANSLGQQLDSEIKSHRDDNFWNSVELNITRAAVVIAVAAGL